MTPACSLASATTESPCSPTHWTDTCSEFLGDCAQHRVIFGRLVVRYSPPVHRLGCKIGIPKASDLHARRYAFLTEAGEYSDPFTLQYVARHDTIRTTTVRCVPPQQEAVICGWTDCKKR